jgi:hypothetical protein
MQLRIALAIVMATAGLSLAAEIPPHMEQVWGGWLSCERGYVMRGRDCIAETAIPPGPEVVVSNLPSAGDGAAGNRACPSGGCGSSLDFESLLADQPALRELSGLAARLPSYGGLFSRPELGGRTLIQDPFLW